MNPASSRENDRLTGLLADEAAAALDKDGVRELAGLLETRPDVDRDQFLQAAALAQVAFLRQARRNAAGRTAQRMPEALREQLATQGEAAIIRQRQLGPSPVAHIGSGSRSDASPAASLPTLRQGRGLAATGWALAAALAIAFFVVRTDVPPGSVRALDASGARIALVRDAPDVITLPWAPPTVAGYERVTGDVVWSQSRQQGYLRLANLPVNDPARTQYQLWIVDPERDTHPVDGGVFNVSATGEVIIAIQAKLQIVAPRAFAITAERPGGVVVSAGPLLVVAST